MNADMSGLDTTAWFSFCRKTAEPGQKCSVCGTRAGQYRYEADVGTQASAERVAQWIPVGSEIIPEREHKGRQEPWRVAFRCCYVCESVVVGFRLEVGQRKLPLVSQKEVQKVFSQKSLEEEL